MRNTVYFLERGGPCLSVAFLLIPVTPQKYGLLDGNRDNPVQLKALDRLMIVRAMPCPGLHEALGPAATVYCGLTQLDKPTCMLHHSIEGKTHALLITEIRAGKSLNPHSPPAARLL